MRDLNVVFVRTDGLGDLVLTLPAAAALKSQLPGTRLSYLVGRYAAPILEHHPDVDDVLFDPGPERAGARRLLLSRGFDAVVFFKPYLTWFWAAYRSGIRRRIGTGYRWYSLLLSDRVYEHRSHFDKHESRYNLNLLAPLGVETESVRPPRLYLTTSEIQEADDLLASLPRPRIIVHPGNVYARNWPTHRYVEAVAALRALGVSVVLTGSKNEGEIFKDAGREGDSAGSGVLDLMGLLDLRRLIAVISRCDLVISGSTGPMHIAAALEVGTLSLFDPRRASSPIRWGPSGDRGKVLMPEVPTCEKCVYERCPYWDCMKQIQVGAVVREAGKILSQFGAGVTKV